jgi:hypothetical protein
MDNVRKIFAEREQATSDERRALTDCLDKYSQAAIDLEQMALQGLSEKLCRFELDQHQDRENWKIDDNHVIQRMTSYFQSTQYKSAFSRLMGLSRYVKQPCTVGYISERVVISRTAAHHFVKDCLAESWITAVQMSNKTIGYWASDVLVEQLEIHARYTSDAVYKIGVANDGMLYRMAVKRKAALHSF